MFYLYHFISLSVTDLVLVHSPAQARHTQHVTEPEPGMMWGKAGKYRVKPGARGHLRWYPGDLDTIRSQCHHRHQHREQWVSPAPTPVGQAGLGSLTVADCPWPVLANICKHCTAQAAARHMADMCQRSIANITVHRQLLKTTNAIRISRDALCAQIVGSRQRLYPY